MADTAQGKVHIVNRALVKLGLTPSYSADTESSLGGTVDLVWPGVEAVVVGTYDLNACRDVVQPVQQAEVPGNGWAYGFVLPADRIGDPIAVLTDITRETYLRDFSVSNGVLCTNVTPVWARISKLRDPVTWDALFSEAFVTALASALAVPLQQDEDARDSLHAEAFTQIREQNDGGLFGRLVAKERGSQPQGRGFMAYDPLTSARFM
jgi:hypothetical protein